MTGRCPVLKSACACCSGSMKEEQGHCQIGGVWICLHSSNSWQKSAAIFVQEVCFPLLRTHVFAAAVLMCKKERRWQGNAQCCNMQVQRVIRLSKQNEYLVLKVRFDDWKFCRSSLEHHHGLLTKDKIKEILRQMLRGKMYLIFFLAEAKWVSCS